MNAQVITFCHHKGGVGKTTTTHNVGAVLADKGYKVLLLDLDAQANLTTTVLSVRPTRTVYDAIKDREYLPTIAVTENLSICPSGVNMAGAEFLLTNDPHREYVLRSLIDRVRPYYDYILIDCPPSLNLITVNALAATDSLTICLTAEVLPYRGLRELLDKIVLVKQNLNAGLTINGIVVTRYKGSRNVCKLILKNLQEEYKDGGLYNTVIRDNVKITEAPMYHKPVTSYAPNSTGAKDYSALADEIINRLNR